MKRDKSRNIKRAIDESLVKKKELKKQKKLLRKEEYNKVKEEVKKIKLKIKDIKKEFKTQKKHIPKKNRNEYSKTINKLREDTYSEIEKYDKQIYDIYFEFGKKHDTLWWNLRKWFFGVGKEFRRIIWSPPLLTIKYLGIVILIVGILSGIFTAIAAITKLI